MDRGISNYFTKGPVVVQPKAKVGITEIPEDTHD
jgi:hypothetical protein